MDNASSKSKADTCAIDSASLVLPLSKLQVLDETLKTLLAVSSASLIVVDSSSGEVIENLNPRINSDVQYTDGITTTYYKIENTNIGARDYRRCIAISVNSKQLKDQYLKGISLDTVTDLYNEINSQGIISVTFDDFVNGFLTDVDIKRDYSLFDGFDDFRHLIDSIFDSAKDEFKITNAVKKFKRKGNEGIQFGYRNNGANLPFFKIYNKKIELENNSSEFMNKHGILCKNIVRLEITLKNKTQMIKHGLLLSDEKQTFNNILANVGVFKMSKVLSVYSGKVMPAHRDKVVADFAKMQKIEKQAFDFTVGILHLLDASNAAATLEDLRETIVKALNPSRNNSRRVNDAIELAYAMYIQEKNVAQESDVFSLFC